jgi:rhamnosyltransferase
MYCLNIKIQKSRGYMFYSENLKYISSKIKNHLEQKVEKPSARISIVGSRGIPAKYGGFEVFADELSVRLNEKGYHVTVCCEYQATKKPNEYRGVRLCYFPFKPPKYYILRKIYEMMNDLYFMGTMAKRCDIMYILGVGTSGWFTFFPKFMNNDIKVLVNIDGLEWKRDKFNKFEKKLLKLNNSLAIIFSDIVILDSMSLKKYVTLKSQEKTFFTPYGASATKKIDWNVDELNELSSQTNRISMIKKNEYWLVVARLEPENNIHITIEAFVNSDSKKPLVIVGESTSIGYKEILNRISSNDKSHRIFFLGSIYENRKLLDMLRQHCFAYIHGHSVGGTNPSLLEAMIIKNIIIANDNEFNREVGGDTILYFKDAVDLANKINDIEKNIIRFYNLKEQAEKRVKTNYSWEKVVEDYVNLFNILLHKKI